MDRAWPIKGEGLAMGSGRISFVLAKIVLRVLVVQLFHNPITRRFGNNGGGSD